ncbi:hypothetical protein DES53_101507 [Roseimicrobium gellanilyticum]|uniref:DUF6891 domain-containing protein n=1 Tax=Roseimicrobium gellanilyticum TaxID=748857 RepID=A0A366HWN0_9BACT|nr:hypothetical protein [Roseimicrobium gellanilyticum]RBP47708.1 hypothetical protein DES53_101507 [Roseimicrobium gellanilyticum]
MSKLQADQAYANQQIVHYVWAGFHSSEDIERTLLEDVFQPGDLDADWVRAGIDREFAKKLEQQIDWPEKTDCDRLDEVFAELEGQQLIALQNAGYTQSDGMEDMSEIWHERGAEKSGVVGYCFYHGQDLERVVKGEPLYLTYGDIAGDDARGVVIGELICRVLERHGFTTNWDRNIKTRMHIAGIDWKRRTPDY